MIGLWSSDAASIVALDLSHGNPAFFIGSLLNLTVPDFSSSLYLFMATNDGIFSDNSEAYSVRIDSIGSADISQVAVPPAIAIGSSWYFYSSSAPPLSHSLYQVVEEPVRVSSRAV